MTRHAVHNGSVGTAGAKSPDQPLPFSRSKPLRDGIAGPSKRGSSEPEAAVNAGRRAVLYAKFKRVLTTIRY